MNIFKILIIIIITFLYIFCNFYIFYLFYKKLKCYKKSFVTCNYNGGLGNQFFQIYTTISYSIDNNKNPIFQYKNTTGYRSTYWDSVFKNLNIRDINCIKWENIKENSSGTYNIDNQIKNKNIMFNGYFQSKHNFIKNMKKINDIIGIDKIKLQTKEKYKNLFNNNDKIIAIHFRIGDYKKLSDEFNILNDEYYINALKNIDIKNKKIFVFCEKEDIETVKNRLKNILKDDKKFIIISNNEVDDIFLISLCDYIIIANSTFSFWGAMFANHKNVYLPIFNWFGDKKNTEDRFCLEGWKIIN
jgi:hypothetical protein